MSTTRAQAAAGVPDADAGGHVVATLRAVGIFADVSDAELAELVSGFSVRELQEGEVLIREGEQGHEFYVLTEGRLRIDRGGPNGDDVHLGDAVPGECVGDLALLRDAPRRATVTALKPSTVLVLERARFRSLLAAHPGARDAVEARIAHVERWTAARLHRPSAEEVVNQLSAILPGVRRELLESIEPEMQWVTLPRGTVLMREGGPADCVYFVVTGRLVAWTLLHFEVEDETHAWQGTTLVDPDHRGRRLGLLVKLENLIRTLDVRPRFAEVDTFNAAENIHMIAINDAIGFQPVDGWVEWQYDA